MMAPLTRRRPPMLPRSTAMSPGGSALDALVAPARMNASTIWRSLMSMMVTAAPMASLDVGRCGESGVDGGWAQGRGARVRGARTTHLLPQRCFTRRRGDTAEDRARALAPDRLGADPKVLLYWELWPKSAGDLAAPSGCGRRVTRGSAAAGGGSRGRCAQLSSIAR